MLENPSDESVVRWGNDGDSFVVLEVCCSDLPGGKSANGRIERKIHKTHLA